MSKSSKAQMEQDEKTLLSELVKNSQASIDTLAQRCGFSRQKVWRMMKHLEAMHKIWGYTAIVDVEQQGRSTFILSFKQSMKLFDNKYSERVNLDEIRKKYSQLGIELQSSYFLHGEYDWVLIFTAEDIKQAKKFSELLLNVYPDLIDKTSLSQVIYSPREHHILNPQSRKVKDIL